MSEWTKVVLNERPKRDITSTTFKITKSKTPNAGDLKQNEILVEVLLMSVDPAMRGWLNDAKSYVPPVQIGEVMRSHGIGRVLHSTNSKFKQGQLVLGMFGFQNYYIGEGEGSNVVPDIGIPYSAFLGPLGGTGLTAYFGLLDVGKIKKGDVVVVSGAAGATGSVAGQIAKAYGCTVVGIAGGSDKIAWLKSLGFDHVIDYKATKNLEGALRTAVPTGVDVYFDNVGGPTLDAVLRVMRRNGRIVICGAISQYNKPPEEWYGPKNYSLLIINRLRMEGFIVFDYQSRYPEAIAKLGEWVKAGKIQYKETRVKGLENASAALNQLYQGGNQGKLLVEITQDERVRSKL